MEWILVVEDDERLGQHICDLIQSAGYVPHLVSKISELDDSILGRQTFHAVILDRLLNGLDSKMRVGALKQRWPSAPILVLSAINTPLERAELLNLGADDYLGKPFLSQELLARLRALTRRFAGLQSNYREVGNLILDLPKRILMCKETRDQLPAKEFLLLKLLSDEIGRVVNKNEILDSVWGSSLDVDTNVVESTVTNLRKRIANIGGTIKIRNSRNVGYWLEE